MDGRDHLVGDTGRRRAKQRRRALMRFTIDENLPPFIATRLREAGFDAMTAGDPALSATHDDSLALVYGAESRILVTLDRDFAAIGAHPRGGGPGVVVFRLHRQDKAEFERATARLLAALAKDDVAGNLWIVERHGVRVSKAVTGTP